jgi:hypothetical protein
MAYTSPIDPQYAQRQPRKTYRDIQVDDTLVAWLRGDAGSRLLFSMGIQLDGLAEQFRLAQLQRFPEYSFPEALQYQGRDRRLFRGLSETDDSYASRLTQARATWKFAGNAPTLLRQLWALLTPGETVRIRYVVNGYTDETASAGTQFTDWWTIDDTGLSHLRVDPSNWDWDGDGAIGYGKQARFWIIIYRSDLTPAVWGTPPPDLWGEAGWYWGTGDGPRDWLADARNVIRTFRAAGSACGTWQGYSSGIIVADPTVVTAPWGAGGPFDPTLSPGYPMPDGDFNLPSNRPPGAVYLSGL